MSAEMEISTEVDAATRALEAMIFSQLETGTNRCVLAAACVWGGVKEMREVTSSESAAAALRAIADQIDPPVELPQPRIVPPADRSFIAAVRQFGGAGRASKQKAAEAIQQAAMNQEIARDVVGEAIDLLDQGRPTEARALLVALRNRFF
jgi:hypothetical protein